MILVTGGTGFIGKALIRKLVQAGHEVRMLIRPSPRSPDVPKGTPVEIAMCGINDERGLQAAMLGVDTIFHLAGAERHGAYANLMEVDIHGTRLVCQVAAESKIERFFFISHLGAERSSAYPISKAKAIGEETIRRSGLAYTIFRTAIIFGENDGLTTGIASLLAANPFFFILPGEGKSILQPLWVEDLTTCMVWALEDEATRNKTYEIGGPEYFTFEEIVRLVMEAVNKKRLFFHVAPPYLRGLTVFMETMFPRLPVSVFWLDYLAANHTCPLDTLPRTFNLMPERLASHVDYLAKVNWRSVFLKSLGRRT